MKNALVILTERDDDLALLLDLMQMAIETCKCREMLPGAIELMSLTRGANPEGMMHARAIRATMRQCGVEREVRTTTVNEDGEVIRDLPELVPES